MEITCPNPDCHIVIPGHYTHCPRCGTNVAKPMVKCATIHCLNPANPGSNYCSGCGVETPTGARRTNVYPGGKKFPVRWDLLMRNDVGMRRLAETWGEGNVKYGPDNWKKGFPTSVMISHALEHISQYLQGDRSEDHLAHAAWNLLAQCYYEEKHPELDDLSVLPIAGSN